MAEARGLSTLLDRLEGVRREFGPGPRRTLEELLLVIGSRRFRDAESLVRFHEALLFVRAYPQSRKVLQTADRFLSAFEDRIKELPESERRSEIFEYLEYSGIAGTTLHGTYSYGIARWLVRQHRADVSVDWLKYDRTERLGYVLPRFLPLLREEALVEQNIPYQSWIRLARKRPANDLVYLIERFENSPLSEKQKSALYDLMGLWIRWELGGTKASRSNNRHLPRRVFYHTGPLVSRRDVSLAKIISTPLRLERLSEIRGQSVIDRCRDTTCVRYRELYGIAYGDPSSVVRADVGRGVEIFLWGCRPRAGCPCALTTRGSH